MVSLKKDYECGVKLINEHLQSCQQSDLRTVQSQLPTTSQHCPGSARHQCVSPCMC